MIKLKLTIVISFYIVRSFAQNATDSMQLMRQTLNIEYNIWRSENPDTVKGLLFRKANLLKQANMFESSNHELGRIVPDSAVQRNLTYELALNSFLRTDFNQSYNLLLSLPDSIIFGYKNSTILWLLTLTELHHWDDCKNIFLQYVAKNRLPANDITDLKTTVKYKSPYLAYKLSTWCPGLGQIYTGSFTKGITNIAIQTGVVWFTWHQYAASFYITGTFAGVYPFYRFYSGGRTQSYNLADAYNETRETRLKILYEQVIWKIKF